MAHFYLKFLFTPLYGLYLSLYCLEYLPGDTPVNFEKVLMKCELLLNPDSSPASCTGRPSLRYFFACIILLLIMNSLMVNPVYCLNWWHRWYLLIKKLLAIVCPEETKWFVSCYIKDEGGPLEVAIQVETSNYLKVLLLKAVVLSVKEKAKLNFVKWVLCRWTKVNHWRRFEKLSYYQNQGCIAILG